MIFPFAKLTKRLRADLRVGITTAALLVLLVAGVRFEQNRSAGGDQRTIYLTFDADMTPDMKRRLEAGEVQAWYSPGLVSYLEDQKIPATLFVTGLFAETYPELMKKLATESQFSIQNHTYDHLAFQPGCYGLAWTNDFGQKKYEIEKTDAIIYGITGRRPQYLRHPGLCHNWFDRVVAWSLGLKTSDAGLISGDAFESDPGVIVERVLAGATPGAVVILHLGGPNAPATESALREIIPKLSASGYRFEALH